MYSQTKMVILKLLHNQIDQRDSQERQNEFKIIFVSRFVYKLQEITIVELLLNPYNHSI
jgi:hypothetical protein